MKLLKGRQKRSHAGMNIIIIGTLHDITTQYNTTQQYNLSRHDTAWHDITLLLITKHWNTASKFIL